jgi:hypothetical protein
VDRPNLALYVLRLLRTLLARAVVVFVGRFDRLFFDIPHFLPLVKKWFLKHFSINFFHPSVKVLLMSALTLRARRKVLATTPSM